MVRTHSGCPPPPAQIVQPLVWRTVRSNREPRSISPVTGSGATSAWRASMIWSRVIYSCLGQRGAWPGLPHRRAGQPMRPPVHVASARQHSAGGRWIRTFGSWSRDRQRDRGRRDCLLENGSGSVGEPEVRIHLPPAESQRRTRAPTIAEETLSAHPVPRVVALLGLIGVSDDATAALDQTAVRRRNRPFANRRVRSKVAAGCSFQRIPSALLIGILRERGIGQCHRTHKRTRSRNPRRLYKASAGLSGNT